MHAAFQPKQFVNLDTYFSADLTKKIQAALKVLKEYGCEDYPTTVSPLLESTHKCLSQLKSIRFFVNPFSLVAADQLTEAQHKVFNAAEKKWLTKQIEKSDKDAAGRIKTTHIVVSACTGSASNQLFNGVLAFPGWAQRIQLKEPVYVDAVEGKVYKANGKEIKGRDKGSSVQVALKAKAGFTVRVNKGRLVVSAVLPYCYPATTVDHHAEYNKHPDYKNNSCFRVRDCIKAVNIKLVKAVKQRTQKDEKGKPEQEECDECEQFESF